MPPTIVAIIGAGNLGKALAVVFAKRADIEVRLWDKDPARMPVARDLASTLENAGAVFLCVPSWAFSEALSALRPSLPLTAVVVSMAKGIEPVRARFMDEVLGEELAAEQPWAVMNGPMLAAELSAGQEGVAVIASRSAAALLQVPSLFAGTNMRVTSSGDVVGVSLLGVLKNVYSIGLGIAEGLEWHSNARGWFVSQTVLEMTALVTRFGGQAETVIGAAGLGDLVATGFSPHSRNRTYGHDLAVNGKCPTDAEGCASLEHLLKRLDGGTEAYPLLHAVAEVVTGKGNARVVFGKLL